MKDILDLFSTPFQTRERVATSVVKKYSQYSYSCPVLTDMFMSQPFINFLQTNFISALIDGVPPSGYTQGLLRDNEKVRFSHLSKTVTSVSSQKINCPLQRQPEGILREL